MKCYDCGGEEFSQKRIDYIYQHDGKMLLVPNTPVRVCAQCGLKYYDGKVLAQIERQFFAIQNKTEQPDRMLQVPEKAFVE